MVCWFQLPVLSLSAEEASLPRLRTGGRFEITLMALFELVASQSLSWLLVQVTA